MRSVIRLIAILGFHGILAGQYRLAGMAPARWMAYTGMGIAFLILTLPWFVDRSPCPSIQERRRDASPQLAWLVAAAIALIVAGGLLVRALWIRATPLDPLYGDMLPLIRDAIQSWQAGVFPYREYAFPWPVPLTFPPALWLAFAPWEIAGLDIRYGTLACLAVIGAIWALLGWRLAVNRASGGWLGTLGWTILVAVFFASPIIVRFVIQGHTAPYWLALVLLSCALVTDRPVATAVLLGIACGMRQPAILYGPLLLLYWQRRSGNWRLTLTYAGISGATAAAIYLPFVIQNPDAVLFEPLRHYAQLGPATLAANPPALLETIGFSNLFHLHGWQAGLTPIATGLALAVIVGFRKRLDHAAGVLDTMAVMTLVFTLFSPFPWYYEYFAVILLLMHGWAAALSKAEPTTLRKVAA